MKISKIFDLVPAWAVIGVILATSIIFFEKQLQRQTIQTNTTAFMDKQGLKCRVDNHYFYVHSKNGWKLRGKNTYKEDILIPLDACTVIEEENRDE